MEVDYDEDVRENRFFQAIRKKLPAQQATREGWIVCVPRQSSFAETSVSEEQIYAHILIPRQKIKSADVFDAFDALNGTMVERANKTVTVREGTIRTSSSHLLFEETFYEGNHSRYRVWCLERPLRATNVPEAGTWKDGTSSRHASLSAVTNLREAVHFLWTECLNKKLLRKLTTIVEEVDADLEKLSVPVQRDTIGRLYDACLTLLLKDGRLRKLSSSTEHFSKNLKLSLETYLLYSLRDTLWRSVSAHTVDMDVALNKILRNVTEFDSPDLCVRTDLRDRIPIAAIKLSHLHCFCTVLEKTECLKRCVRYLSHGLPSVSSDDLLPALVLIVIRADLPNWIAQLTFLKYFRFSVPFLCGADEASFLITSFEAAIEYLRNRDKVALEDDSDSELCRQQQQQQQQQEQERLSRSCSRQGRRPRRRRRCRQRHRHQRRHGHRGGASAVTSTTAGERYSSTLFASIKRGDLSEVEEILSTENCFDVGNGTVVASILCHPLCTCATCEKNRLRFDSLEQSTVRLKNEKGLFTLHVAASYGRVNIITLLLSRDADARDLIDDYGRTALHWAAIKGHYEAIRALLAANADPTVCDLRKDTPLHLAAEHGQKDCVEVLLRFAKDSGWTLLDPNSVNLDGETPLHRASKWGYRVIVQTLLVHGADPTVRNKRGETPVSLAHNRYISSLLTNAESRSLPEGSSIDPITFRSVYLDRSPLESSVSFEKSTVTEDTEDAMERVIEKLFGAITDGDTQLACYYLGLGNIQEKIVHRTNATCHPLCDCARCSIDEEANDDYDDYSAAVYKCEKKARRNGRRRVLTVNARNHAGETALHVASAIGSMEMVRIILDAGANVNAKTFYESRTPLHLACLCHNVRVLELLLNCATCDLDAKDRNGDTPLHFAVKTANPKLVRTLVRYGASTNVRNSRGVTPLQQLQEEISKDDSSLPLVDISNILKRNFFENSARYKGRTFFDEELATVSLPNA